jgi:hypothetical protein
MKIMATKRYLPILLVSAIMAVSCTGVQDVAAVTPTPTSLTVKGNYSFSEVIDSIQTQVKTETEPAQFFYLKREYSLELAGNGTAGNSDARLFIIEWAAADRVFITQFKGSYTLSNNEIQLVLKNMTLCDGIDIFVQGNIENGTASQLKLSVQHCPPANKNIVLTAEPALSTITKNSTTHN